MSIFRGVWGFWENCNNRNAATGVCRRAPEP